MLIFITLIVIGVMTPRLTYAQQQKALPTFAPIVISEVQAGSAVSASQEFIELYNQSSEAIDLGQTEWQVQIASSTATDWSKAKTIALTGIFYPGTYMLLASNYIASGETKSYLQDYASKQFSSGMTSYAGHIRLASRSSATSSQTVVDAVEWSTRTASGELTAAPIAATKALVLDDTIAAGQSIKRKISLEGVFLKTYSASANGMDDDWLISSCPSPTATNILTTHVGQTEPLPTDIDVSDQPCAPQDDDDPGTSPIEPPTTQPPAVLIPDESNEPTTSSSSATIPASDIGLVAPQITELLPNPAAPQTDAADEFIELYNSNATAFDLSGFQLEIGATTKKYVFPHGTVLTAHSFRAFFSADTHLGLSNTAGQILLVDPLGHTIGQSNQYNTAKEGQAWVLAAGAWQWTAAPTPNATNIVQTVAVKATKKTVATTSKQATKATAATAKTKQKAATKSDISMAQPVATVVAASPLHFGVLAVVGSFAILYGVYEYRRDVANKFYQLRNYRAARRAHRQDTAGRRSD